MRRLEWTVFVLGVLILAGCGKPAATPMAAPGSVKPDHGSSEHTATVRAGSLAVMTVGELEKKLDFSGHFKAEELTADLQSKVIEVEGEIRTIEAKSGDRLPRITVGTVGTYDTATVIVQDPSDEFTARYGVRQQVTLHGKAGEMKESEFSDPQKDILWSIVKAGPNPSVIMPAVDLAKEFKADPAAAAAKYENQGVYLLGEVVSPDEIDDSFTAPLYTHVILKGAEGIDLDLSMDTSSIQKLGWKPGSQVQVLVPPAFQLQQEDDRSYIPFHACTPVVVKLPLAGVTYGAPASAAK